MQVSEILRHHTETWTNNDCAPPALKRRFYLSKSMYGVQLYLSVKDQVYPMVCEKLIV